MVEKCPILMEINWRGCRNVGVDVFAWMKLQRPSLRKIIASSRYCLTEDEENWFMRLGCGIIINTLYLDRW